MPITEQIARRAMETGGRLRVRSALNPALWLCALITIPGIGVITMSPKEPPLLVQIVVALPVCVAAIGFIYLLIADRDKLQSEDYQIRKRSLELVQEKGDRFPAMARAIEAITNPQLKRLETRMEGDE